MLRQALWTGLLAVACIPHAAAPAPRALAPVQPSTPERAANEPWVTETLRDGSIAEIRAEHPRAKLDQLGLVTFTISGKSGHFVATGLDDICGDPRALASRAPNHDFTDVTITEVARRGSVLVLAVALEAHSGEDVQEGFFQTSLWLFDPARAGAAPRRIWIGEGGEYHQYFEVCSFVAHVTYELDDSGTLTRRCRRDAERDPGSRDYPDCATGPNMTCVDETIGIVSALER